MSKEVILFVALTALIFVIIKLIEWAVEKFEDFKFRQGEKRYAEWLLKQGAEGRIVVPHRVDIEGKFYNHSIDDRKTGNVSRELSGEIKTVEGLILDIMRRYPEEKATILFESNDVSEMVASMDGEGIALSCYCGTKGKWLDLPVKGLKSVEPGNKSVLYRVELGKFERLATTVNIEMPGGEE